MKRIKTVFVTIAIFSFLLFPAARAWADQVHRAKPGETLYSIARDNNLSVEQMIAANPFIESPLFVVPYQIVLIPDQKPGTGYSVRHEDTLDSIAAEHGIDPGALAVYNNLGKKQVFPGQILIIPPSPGGAKPPSNSPGPKKTAYEYNIPKLRAQFPDSLFLSGGRDKKVVALTFDDGPDADYTPRILDILNQQGVKATFFLVGSRVKDYSQLVGQLVDSGHQVADHSWAHTNFRLKTVEEVERDLADTSAALKSAAGVEPVMFRPPYGELSPEAMKVLVDSGYTTVGWNADSLDWYSGSVDRILASALRDTRPGSIILMHSTGKNLEATVKALPELIYTLKAQGYGFITVAELLGRPAYR